MHDDELEQEVQRLIEEQQAERERLVQKQAERIMRKNRREVDRLRKHAEDCLISNNKEGYIYAIAKMRKLINKSVDRDVLETLWQTSRDEVLKIMASFEESLNEANKRN